MPKRKASISEKKSDKKRCIAPDEECSICCNPFIKPSLVEEFELKNAYSSTSCGHFFHTECLGKWWLSSNGQTCPLCRHKESLSSSNLNERSLLYFYMKNYGKAYNTLKLIKHPLDLQMQKILEETLYKLLDIDYLVMYRRQFLEELLILDCTPIIVKAHIYNPNHNFGGTIPPDLNKSIELYLLMPDTDDKKWFYVGFLYLLNPQTIQNNLLEATKCFEKFLSNGGNLTILDKIARRFVERKDFNSAKEIFKQSFLLGSNQSGINLCKVYAITNNNLMEIIPILKQIKISEPELITHDVLKKIGSCVFKKENLNKTMGELELYCNDFAVLGFEKAMFILCHIYLKTNKNLLVVIRYFESLIKTFQNKSLLLPLYFNIGMLYYNGSTEELQQDKEKGLELIKKAADDLYQPAIEFMSSI